MFRKKPAQPQASRPAAHYHDADPVPIAGGWACYCASPETYARPANWSEIRRKALAFRE